MAKTKNMQIDSFKNAMRDGGARANLFEVRGNFPTVSVSDMQFLINAASLPADNVGTIPVPYRGRELKLAGDRTFDPWTITVYNTNDFAIRDAFEQWSEIVNGHFNNKSALDVDEYMFDWEVDQLKRDGTVAATYKILSCYPESVGEITVGHSQGNTLEEFQVTLQYQYWTRSGITNLSS